MTDDERAALVDRALLAHMDFFGADAFTDEARDAMCVVVAIIEDAIRADERARVVAEATTDEAVRRAARVFWNTDGDAQGSDMLAAIRAALEATP
jgi:uncharacterized protein (DUF1697 family)